MMVENLADFDFSKTQIGLFSPGASVSEIYAPKAGKAGCIVIDNTFFSHFSHLFYLFDIFIYFLALLFYSFLTL